MSFLGIIGGIGVWVGLTVFFSKASEAGAKARAELEEARARHRDADTQSEPYTYGCVGRPNRTLALRYGIANQEKVVEEYWFYGPGGAKERNPARDRVRFNEATQISLRKIEKVRSDGGANVYLAELPEWGNRKVHVAIAPGSENVKEFLPIAPDSWFDKHVHLEEPLKDNRTFSLKELAKFHVDMVMWPNPPSESRRRPRGDRKGR
jgi:hypothetical protein